MAGIVQDQGYHDREVASSLDGNRVIHHGPVGGSARSQMLGSARALLHLINFEEPFGLSVVEAMACGTPVIAFHRGSMTELIIDGVTGCLVATMEEAIAAVGRIGEINRPACGAHVLRHFTAQVMAER